MLDEKIEVFTLQLCVCEHCTVIPSFAMSREVKRVSDVPFEMRAIIEFLTKEGEQPKNIYERLKKVFGSECFDISTVRYWALMVKKNEVNVQDWPWSSKTI
ncbi:hypothetical protein PGB90_008871 [Kerria lacca]